MNHINKTQQEDQSRPKQKSGFLFVLAAVFISILVAVSYYFTTQKISRIKSKVGQTTMEISHLRKENEKLQENISELREVIQQTKVDRIVNWEPIFIEQLIRMANLILNTTGDVKEVLLFLSVAKKYAADSEYSSINQALNKDIADLKVVPVIDSQAIILKIERLNKKIDELPLVAKLYKHPDSLVENEKKELSSKNLWKNFLLSAKEALRNIVEIRERNVKPLLLPDQEVVLRLNIRARLIQAELAVMERQSELYRSCLDEVARLIERYFSLNDDASDVTLYIEELKKIDLRPKLPSLLDSISAVANFMRLRDFNVFEPNMLNSKDAKN